METNDLELVKDFAAISQMIKTLVKKGLIRSIQHDLTSLSAESRESVEFIQNCHKYPQLLQESLLDVKSRCNAAQVFDYFKVHLEDCFFKSYGDLIRQGKHILQNEESATLATVVLLQSRNIFSSLKTYSHQEVYKQYQIEDAYQGMEQKKDSNKYAVKIEGHLKEILKQYQSKKGIPEYQQEEAI